MDELLCPCVVVIPLDYNPEHEGAKPREVEPRVLTEILSWLDRQFGGWRQLASANVPGIPSGSWHGQPDRCMTVTVAIPPHRTEEFKAVVYTIGQRLKQKAMYIEIGPPIARIMLIDDDEPGAAAVGGK